MKISPLGFVSNSIEFGKKLKPLPLDERVEEGMHSMPSASDDLKGRIDDALSRLTHEQEAVLRGRHGIGCEIKTNQAIADELGIPKSKLPRIRKEAEAELGEYFALQGYKP